MTTYDTGKVEFMTSPEQSQIQNLRLLWVVNLDPTVGENHGAGMRFLNFARELSLAGAHVYFAVNAFPDDDRSALEQFLSKLQKDGIIAGWIVLEYRYTVWQGRIGSLALHTGLSNWILRDRQSSTMEMLRSFNKNNGITAAMVSDRRLFFMGDALRTEIPTILDWTDSLTLHYWRALGAKLRGGELSGLYGFLRDYQANATAEWYYGRRAHLNTTVSPVDKHWFDRTNLKPERNRLWMNGTKTEEWAPVTKIPKRLIFSGAMDYTPNYEGALWFIDEVFPLVLKRHPEATFVVAGVNPVGKLAARASDQIQITGFVEDLGAEIARSSLYVAPLLSGGGFRNKVVEALVKGTYLVGTPMSVEFLPDDFRKLIPVAHNSGEMAELVGKYLDNPAAYQDRLEQLRQVVISDFSWRGRTGDLLRFLAEAEQNFRA